MQRTLPETVKELREGRGWTMGQLAAYAEVTTGYISKLEAGKIDAPGSDVLQRLARALRVDVSTLLGVSRHTEPETADLLRQALAKMEREPTLDMMFKGYERLSEAEARQFMEWALRQRRRQDAADARDD